MRRTWRTRILAGVVVLLGVAAPTAPTWAQGRGGPKVIELDEMVVEGKVSKPEVFYVLGRSALRYNNLRLERSFVDRILESARLNPF